MLHPNHQTCCNEIGLLTEPFSTILTYASLYIIQETLYNVRGVAIGQIHRRHRRSAIRTAQSTVAHSVGQTIVSRSVIPKVMVLMSFSETAIFRCTITVQMHKSHAMNRPRRITSKLVLVLVAIRMGATILHPAVRLASWWPRLLSFRW